MKKLITLGIGLVMAVAAMCQVQTMKSTFNLASDTVTNTGTVWLQASNVKGHGVVTLQVVATKISGTVAGTISIQGSTDGTNFKAIPTVETQTGVATATATDVASQTFVWRLSANHFTDYRISWTGSGTMAASFTGTCLLVKDR